MSCKNVQKLSFKTNWWYEKFVVPTTDIWFKCLLAGIHSINSIMKNMVQNSTFQNIDKNAANNSARKALVKKFEQNQVAKSEIISTISTSRFGLVWQWRRNSWTVSF